MSETNLEGKNFDEVAITNGDDDFLFCKIQNNIFHGSGDTGKLKQILEIFKNWAEF